MGTYAASFYMFCILTAETIVEIPLETLLKATRLVQLHFCIDALKLTLGRLVDTI